MGFFRRIFGGGGDGGSKEPVDTAWHFYVKSNYADEIIDVRVDPNADLSPEFDGPGDGASHYTTNKDIIGAKSFRTIHLYLVFDAGRAYTGDYTIEGGELVDQATFEAWNARATAAKAGDADTDAG